MIRIRDHYEIEKCYHVLSESRSEGLFSRDKIRVDYGSCWKVMVDRSATLIDLFAGCGGLS